MHATYAIDVTGSSLPLRVPIPTIRNAGKRPRHIPVDARALGKVELVPVGVGIGATGVACLRASGDGQAAGAGAAEGDSALDGCGADALIGGAGTDAGVRAAAGGAGVDAGGFQLALGLCLGEGLRRDDGRGQKSGENGGELEEAVSEERYSSYSERTFMLKISISLR